MKHLELSPMNDNLNDNLELSPINDNLELSLMNDNLELSPLHKFILKLKDFSKDLTQGAKASNKDLTQDIGYGDKMKKILIFLLLFGTSLLAQNTMVVNSVSGLAKDTISINVNIQNTDQFTGFQFEIPLSNQLVYIDNSAILTDRASGHILTASVINGTTLKVFAYSTTMAEFSGNSGEVCSFKLKMGTIPGDYNLIIENGIIGNSESQNILTNFINGVITIEAPDIDISQTSLDYDRVPLLQYSDRNFNIINNGNRSLSVSRVYTDFSDFEVVGDTSFSVNAGSSRTVTVRFHSNVKGIYNKQVKVLCDDPDEPVKTVALSVVAYAVNELDINDLFGRSGHEATMSIDISNMEPFVGFSFDLNVPDVMTYLPNSTVLTNRKTDHVVSATTLDNGKVRIVSYSPTNAVFIGNEGDVISLDFLIDGQGGFYNINFSDPVIGDISKENIISDHYAGVLEIAAPDIDLSSTTLYFGDVSIFETPTKTFTVNNYGTDTLKINSITTNETHFTTSVSLPVNLVPGQNIQIPVIFHSNIEKYYTANLRIRSNDPDEDPIDIQLSAKTFTPNIMRVDSTSITWNDTGWVSVSIENYEPFVGFQFDMQLPEGITYAGQSQLTSRAVDHSLSVSLISSNVLRVFAYSLSQAAILNQDGPVLNIKLRAGSQPGDFPLQLSDVIIGNAQSENIMSSYENGVVSVLGTKTLALNSGWNLISWNYNTANDSLINLFASVLNKVVVVLGFEKIGLTYDPRWPQFSNLHFVDHLHGYWLNLSAEKSFSLVGSYVSPSTSIELETGWNLVSYLPNSIDDIAHALQSIYSNLIVVLGFEQGGLTYDPNWPQFSNLQQMKPGFGYWIKVRNACTLTYPTAKYLAKVKQDEYDFTSTVIPTTEWISIFGEGVICEGKLIQPGSIVKVLDKNGIVCGFGKVSQEGCFGMISVYRDEPRTIIDEGAEPGEEVAVYINDRPLSEKVVWKEKGDVIHLTGQKDDTKTAPQDYELVCVFPNPFNSQTSIRFALSNSEKVDLTIINTKGELIRKIVNDVLPSGEHSLYWDGTNNRGQSVASGIYMIQIKSNSIHHLQKVVYIR